jgi:hypothetical protein
VNTDGASLVVAAVAGAVPTDYVGTTTDFGRRIAGWVAANKTLAVNSPAALDLDRPAGTGGLISSLVCPLNKDGQLVGALALYSAQENAFSQEHQAYAERFANVLSAALQPHSRSATSLPHSPTGLDQLLSQVEGSVGWWPVGVIVTRLQGSVQSTANEQRISSILRRSVRAEDSLLRIDPGAFLLLLLRSNEDVTRQVASRLQEELGPLDSRAVVEWASVGREPGSDNQAFSSLADAIRQTAQEADGRTRRTTH